MTVVIEHLDGTETKAETVPSHYEKPEDVSADSGMYQALKDFLPEKTDDKGGEETDANKTDEEKQTETNLKAVIAKPEKERTDEDKALIDANKELYESLTKAPEPKKLEEMEATELIEEVKKNQRLVSERDTKLKDFETIQTENTQLKTELQELKGKKVGEDPTAQAFFEELRKDVTGAWSKYKDKLNLPDLGLIQSQFNGGGHQARLKQYIEGTLKPQLEKEFGMDKGTFKFSMDEAESDPESASARYLTLKKAKETELHNEVTAQETKESAVAAAVKAQQQTDLKWYADKYLGGDEAKMKELWQSLEAKSVEVYSGKAKPEEHPFSLRHVLRGYMFDSLLKEATDKAVGELKQQYADLGLFLPGETKETVTNLSKVKSGQKPNEKSPFKIEQSEFSPMLGTVENVLNTPTKK